MRIIIEIDCKPSDTATVRTETATTKYSEVAEALAANLPAPPEALRVAAAIGASSAGSAPTEGRASSGPALDSPMTAKLAATDAGPAPGS